MAHSKGPTKGKKLTTTDSDELRKPTKLKPVKGKVPKKAKDVSAFEEEEDPALEILGDDDIPFNELGDDDEDDDF